MMRIFVPVAAALLLVCHLAGTAVALTYKVIDLGMLPGYSYGSEAYGINASGQVVGISAKSGLADGGGGGGHIFLYSGGIMTDLGAGLPHGINSSGKAVGDAWTSGFVHGFLYSGGSRTDLTPALPYGWGSSAKAINASGQICGNAAGYAFVYSGGYMTNLGTLPGSYASAAQDINDNGQIVGHANFTSGYPSMWQHAFLYTSSDGFTDLGTLGGENSVAVAINANGEVLGKSQTSSGESHGFLYSSSQGMTDLGMLNVTDMNDLGQIVGTIFASGTLHAMLYSGGVATDLNSLVSSSSGLTLLSANAINNAGQIAGYGKDASGTHHAFLATPVPEPAALVLFSVGAISLLGCTWRWRKRTPGRTRKSHKSGRY